MHTKYNKNKNIYVVILIHLIHYVTNVSVLQNIYVFTNCKKIHYTK